MHHPPSALAPNQPLPPASPPPEATALQPTTNNTASQGLSNSAQNINSNNITNNNIQLVAQPALTPTSNPPASNPPTVPPEAIAFTATAPPSQNQASDPVANQISKSVEIPLVEATAELARDLLIKTRQIAHLVSVLPGVEKSEEEQTERIKALEWELRQAELERVEAVREMESWRGKLDVVIGGVRR